MSKLVNFHRNNDFPSLELNTKYRCLEKSNKVSLIKSAFESFLLENTTFLAFFYGKKK